MQKACFVTAVPIRRNGTFLPAVCSDNTRTHRKRVLGRTATVQAAASSPRTAAPRPPAGTPPPSPPNTPLFQCSRCKTPYPPVPPLQLSNLPAQCPSCSARVVQRDGYVDMTAESASPLSVLRSLMTRPSRSALFQLPTVSYAYERGWRDNFSIAGFPGIDSELDLFLDFAGPCATVLDLSCGSGLMARRLAVSGEIGRVVASDYSDAMMRETVRLARADVTAPEFDVVRADVNALPFVDNAFEAIHCGAALHSWPSVQDGLAEVRRVLQPGGKLFATTFLRLPYLRRRDWLVARPRLMKAAIRVEELIPGDKPYRFFEEDELEYLMKAAGFVNVDIEERKACAIIRCQSPENKP